MSNLYPLAIRREKAGLTLVVLFSVLLSLTFTSDACAGNPELKDQKILPSGFTASQTITREKLQDDLITLLNDTKGQPIVFDKKRGIVYVSYLSQPETKDPRLMQAILQDLREYGYVNIDVTPEDFVVSNNPLSNRLVLNLSRNVEKPVLTQGTQGYDYRAGSVTQVANNNNSAPVHVMSGTIARQVSSEKVLIKNTPTVVHNNDETAPWRGFKRQDSRDSEEVSLKKARNKSGRK